MFQLFELIMTAVLAYMAYTVYEGCASPAVLGMLLIVQGLFWTLDFLCIRPTSTTRPRLAVDRVTLSESYSRG